MLMIVCTRQLQAELFHSRLHAWRCQQLIVKRSQESQTIYVAKNIIKAGPLPSPPLPSPPLSCASGGTGHDDEATYRPVPTTAVFHHSSRRLVSEAAMTASDYAAALGKQPNSLLPQSSACCLLLLFAHADCERAGGRSALGG